MTEHKKEVPQKFANLIKEIEVLNVLELSELVKTLEERYGVSALSAMPKAVASQAAESAGAEAAEKTSFDVHLTEAGGQKIQVIKAVRELTGKGLKEAKDLVDKAPQIVKAGIPKTEADEIKKKLEEAGAKAEIK